MDGAGDGFVDRDSSIGRLDGATNDLIMDHSPPVKTNGYDRLAGVYRSLEWITFRWKLMHSRMALVSELTSTFEKANGRSIDRVLVLGDGDGRLLGQLRSILPEADFVALDSSKQMLHLQMKSFQRAEVLGTQGLGDTGFGDTDHDPCRCPRALVGEGVFRSCCGGVLFGLFFSFGFARAFTALARDTPTGRFGLLCGF